MAGHPAEADELPWPADAVEVGRILGAWGVKGWIKVQPFSGDPKALFSTKRWFIESAAPASPRAAAAVQTRGRLMRVTQAREHGEFVVAKPEGSDDRAAAEAWQSARIFVSRASFPTPGQDEFYWIDLIGLAVVNRQGEALGVVADLLDTGAHCVLRIAAEGAAERLVPFVAAYVDDVNLAERRITVDWALDY